MNSPIGINGRFSGGPLDGYQFSLPPAGGLVGASLLVLVDNHDGTGPREHQYDLIPLELTSEMRYRGELDSSD